VFVERCPATDSVPAHFKLLSGDTRKVLDEPYQGCPGGVIADEPEEHSLFAEFGMYYKSPEIAPLAQPANPLEATTGEATTGAGAAPTGGAPAGTAMPIEDGVAVRWPAVRCGAVRWPAGRPARRPPEPPARGRPRVGVEVWCRGVEARAQQGPRDSPLV